MTLFYLSLFEGLRNLLIPMMDIFVNWKKPQLYFVSKIKPIIYGQRFDNT